MTAYDSYVFRKGPVLSSFSWIHVNSLLGFWWFNILPPCSDLGDDCERGRRSFLGGAEKLQVAHVAVASKAEKDRCFMLFPVSKERIYNWFTIDLQLIHEKIRLIRWSNWVLKLKALTLPQWSLDREEIGQILQILRSGDTESKASRMDLLSVSPYKEVGVVLQYVAITFMFIWFF